MISVYCHCEERSDAAIQLTLTITRPPPLSLRGRAKPRRGNPAEPYGNLGIARHPALTEPQSHGVNPADSQARPSKNKPNRDPWRDESASP